MKKKAVRRMGGGMMGPKKKMARGGPVKKMGGGMMGPKKKTAKMMGGGMMGPKKKMAKGGALAKARSRKPSGRLNVDDIKRGLDKMDRAPIPTGRSAAAKRLAGKGKATATIIGRMKEGKGNPAGKDMSLTGRIRSLLAKRKPKGKSMDMGPKIKRKGKGIGSMIGKMRRKAAGKKK